MTTAQFQVGGLWTVNDSLPRLFGDSGVHSKR